MLPGTYLIALKSDRALATCVPHWLAPIPGITVTTDPTRSATVIITDRLPTVIPDVPTIVLLPEQNCPDVLQSHMLVLVQGAEALTRPHFLALVERSTWAQETALLKAAWSTITPIPHLIQPRYGTLPL